MNNLPGVFGVEHSSIGADTGIGQEISTLKIHVTDQIGKQLGYEIGNKEVVMVRNMRISAVENLYFLTSEEISKLNIGFLARLFLKEINSGELDISDVRAELESLDLLKEKVDKIESLIGLLAK